MLMPLCLWLGTFVGIFAGVSYYLDLQLREAMGAGYTSFNLIREAPEALFDLVVFTHLIGYWYLWTAGIVPVMVGRAFRKFPPSTQELLQNRRRFFMVIPSIIVLASFVTPIFDNHFTQDPDFEGHAPGQSLPLLHRSQFGGDLLSRALLDREVRRYVDQP